MEKAFKLTIVTKKKMSGRKLNQGSKGTSIVTTLYFFNKKDKHLKVERYLYSCVEGTRSMCSHVNTRQNRNLGTQNFLFK